MKPVRLLAIIEAETLTGPAKNLLQFAHLAGSGMLDPIIEVAVATFVRRGRTNSFVDAVQRAGIVVHVLPERHRYDSAVITALRSLAGRTRPDLIQTHAVKSHFLTRVAGLHRLAPWVAYHHGYTSPDWRMRVYNRLDRWSLQAAARVLTVSGSFKEDLARNGVARERIEVVHNAIDPQWGTGIRSAQTATTMRATLGIGSSKKVILTVGRLSREKDHITLLKSLRQLRLRRPGLAAHLVVVGDGPERSRIERAVASLDLSEDVTLTGQVSSMEPFYAIADLAVLPSRSEGSPNALLEAMATGVPVVATTVGGIPEIVTGGESALLVDPGKADSLADAMAALLSDGDLATRIASHAYQRVVTRHSPEARARRLWKIYLELLSRGLEAEGC